MTAADKASVARLLEQVAERLAAAPAATKESAERYAASNPGVNTSAFQAGGLEQVCRNEAAAIRYLIAEYLTPAPALAMGAAPHADRAADPDAQIRRIETGIRAIIHRALERPSR